MLFSRTNCREAPGSCGSNSECILSIPETWLTRSSIVASRFLLSLYNSAVRARSLDNGVNEMQLGERSRLY
jgi:hypothetical protein